MNNLLCHMGNLGSLGSWGTWGWIGLILHLVFWVGLFAGLTLLVVWAVRRVRFPVATAPSVARQPTEMEILQVQYARGDITREQYVSRIQKIDKP
ncbi:MAG TPA: hypothetical protein VLA49_09780 [Anaerolineales bacterium]|nr:hypothetical protein [Anaerolineales bacterium]